MTPGRRGLALSFAGAGSLSMDKSCFTSLDITWKTTQTKAEDQAAPGAATDICNTDLTPLHFEARKCAITASGTLVAWEKEMSSTSQYLFFKLAERKRKPGVMQPLVRG
ncbi:uncharacterized protein LOC121830097 [Peromyscus maniculatus bairdii]|uniref:uncharacterized protein LOC121830097 n=1 Tax=Peromyscus maniculatus bairdii TaxID=230844 RepID=UPI003FD5C979